MRRSLLQVDDIKAILGSDSGYEVALLLEPAPPAPLDAVVNEVMLLVNAALAPTAAEVESKEDQQGAGTSKGVHAPSR